MGAGPESDVGTPRWVKAFAVIALVLIVLVVVIILVGGNHGPGRHGLSANPGYFIEMGLDRV